MGQATYALSNCNATFSPGRGHQHSITEKSTESEASSPPPKGSNISCNETEKQKHSTLKNHRSSLPAPKIPKNESYKVFLDPDVYTQQKYVPWITKLTANHHSFTRTMIQWPCLIWPPTSQWEHTPLYFQRRPQGCPQAGRQKKSSLLDMQLTNLLNTNCGWPSTSHFWEDRISFVKYTYHIQLQLVAICILTIHIKHATFKYILISMPPMCVKHQSSDSPRQRRPPHPPARQTNVQKQVGEWLEFDVSRMIFERNSCKTNCISLASAFSNESRSVVFCRSHLLDDIAAKPMCAISFSTQDKVQTTILHLMKWWNSVGCGCKEQKPTNILKKASNRLFNGFWCLVTLLLMMMMMMMMMLMMMMMMMMMMTMMMMMMMMMMIMSMIMFLPPFPVCSPASKYRRRHSSPSAATRVPAEKFSSNNATWEYGVSQFMWSFQFISYQLIFDT